MSLRHLLVAPVVLLTLGACNLHTPPSAPDAEGTGPVSTRNEARTGSSPEPAERGKTRVRMAPGAPQGSAPAAAYSMADSPPLDIRTPSAPLDREQYAHFDDNLSDLKQRIAERIVSS